jgi:SAM-dependent methyltransferase
VWSTDWRDFFGDHPYPFDLEQVERRDAADARAPFVSALLGPAPRRVLDLGCGYGRHMAALTRHGHEVHGTDTSRRAVERANQRLPRPTAVVADNGRLPFRNGVFDAAVSFYTSLGYAGTSDRAVFREAARVVRPGGHLVVDVANGSRRPFAVGWERVPTGVAVWARYGRGAEVRQRNLTLSRRSVGMYGFAYRRYSPDSLARDLAGDGEWAVQHVHGDFDGGPASAHSGRIVVVACRL